MSKCVDLFDAMMDNIARALIQIYCYHQYLNVRHKGKGPHRLELLFVCYTMSKTPTILAIGKYKCWIHMEQA